MHPIKLISNGPSAALPVMTSSPHPNDQGKESNQHRNPSSFPRKPEHCSRTFLSSPHPPIHTHPGPTIHVPQWGAASGGVLCLWFCESELSRCSSEKSQDLGGTHRFTLSDPCGTRIHYTPESNRGGCISKTVLVSQARTPGFWKEVLTSLVVSVRIRSKSSTNCLKVGLCEGTACQQSLIIIYLEEMGFLGEFFP